MSYRKALTLLTEAHGKTLDELERFDGSLSGIHKGIGDMHTAIMRKLDQIGARLGDIEGELKNVETAANTIPVILRRLHELEEEAGIGHEGPSNGSS
jgi:archaellum component FlaC